MRSLATALLALVLATSGLGGVQAQTGNPVTARSLKITGSGSTGDVSGMSVTTLGGASKLSDRLAPMIAADPTGVADALPAFRDAARTTPYQVAPGTYRLSSPVIDHSLTLNLPCIGVTFPNQKVYGPQNRPCLYYPGQPQLAHVIEKARAGQTVTILTRGDSILWGLAGDGGGSSAVEGNGYTGARSSITIAQALQSALRSVYQYNSAGGQNVTVVNQGYPGDRTYEVYNRWTAYDAANKVDVAILNPGINDSLAPYPVQEYINYYRMTLDRLRGNGTAIIIMLPSPSPTLAGNAQLAQYREAVTRLAREYNLPVIDAAEQLRRLDTPPWVAPGDVHLTTPAYNVIGRSIAPLLSPMGGLLSRQIGPGARITAADMPGDGFGGNITQAPYAASRSGYIIQINSTYTFSVPVYVERDVIPIYETITPDAGSGQTRHLSLKINGDTAVTGNFPGPVFDGTFRRAFAGPVLRRGYHLLQFTATGAQAAFLDQIRFADPATATIGTGGVFRRSALAPWSRPRAFLTGQVAERDTLKTPWTQWVDARLRLGPQQAGIGLVGNEAQNLGYLSNSSLIVLRDGPNLIIRDLATGTADVTAAGVFPADQSEVEFDIALEFTSPTPGQGQLNVYLNGATTATVSKPNPPLVGGYVTVFSLQPGVARLLSLRVLDG